MIANSYDMEVEKAKRLYNSEATMAMVKKREVSS